VHTIEMSTWAGCIVDDGGETVRLRSSE
jgi:hypothetical protein